MVKQLARQILPRWAFTRLRNARWYHIRRLARLTGDTVLAGPFAGMIYKSSCFIPFASGGGNGILEKLIGAYEHQCSDFVSRAIARGYSQVINIGAGEGYYAVGLALKIPYAKVIAFEADPYNQDLLAQHARANSVADRLTIHGSCTWALLAASLAADSFIVSDCEGAELELLDPLRIPALFATDMLVETHDYARRGISEALLERFSATHDIEVVHGQEINIANHPVPRGLSALDRKKFTSRARTDQLWLSLSCKVSRH